MDIRNSGYFDRLVVDEVFEYLDMPRIFTCKSPAGQRYLVINTEEDDDSASWLYIAVSPERLVLLREAALTLRQAVLEPEDGIVYLLKSGRGEAGNDVTLLESASVPAGHLPGSHKYLIRDSVPPARSSQARHTR